MKVPAVLPTVQVEVNSDGTLSVDLDGTPYAVDRYLTRGDLRTLIDEISADLASPVRIDLREADGTAFCDIAMPPTAPSPPRKQGSELSVHGSALASTGFQPGERIALAYIVSDLTADDNGTTTINLPPALAAAARKGLVLLGMTSNTITPLRTIDGTG